MLFVKHVHIKYIQIMKRIFIIHGWGGTPEREWFSWLKSRLQEKGLMVEIPQMPDTHHPTIEAWVPYLAEVVGVPDHETYFIGHSIGCQAIMRYLETLDEKIGGAVFVGGFVALKPLSGEAEALSKLWLENKIDLKKVKAVINKGVAIFSDNDYFVPLEENRDVFERDLGCSVVVEHQKGHFSETDGVTELPSVFEAILQLIQD